MADFQKTVQKHMAEMRKAFSTELAGRIEKINQIWDDIVEGKGTQESIESLHRMTHTLAGSGSTFGFSSVSKSARIAEGLLKSLVLGNTPPDESHAAQISVLLDELKEAANHPDPEPSAEGLQALFRFNRLPNPREENRLIFLIEDDAAIARDLAIQLGYFGYETRIFPSPEGLKEAVDKTPPSAIIMDIIFPEGNLAGTETINKIKASWKKPIPVVYVSGRDDFEARLLAFRSGGNAYFSKPVTISALIDKLDLLTARLVPEPFRILIVDDDHLMANFYSLILKQAGMTCFVENIPSRVPSRMTELRPDLILMDLYMPECTGLELSAVIRQQESYVGIPIVFFSTEPDIHKQLAAMDLGGDDFITKPIQPEHLVSVVKNRAERYRSLRAFMIRDSLTRLLNHSFMKEQLSFELLRSKRTNRPLAYAIIDIDRFKSINDTNGHSSGDRVIKTLARLLEQRLRKTDLIGRYGGDEFVVILPDTDGKTAFKILDEIRAGFASLHHQSGKDPIISSFSCGIASFPDFQDLSTLSDAADHALYKVKKGGGNQTQLAVP